jgi:PadR family transcriptional regulator PadR
MDVGKSDVLQGTLDLMVLKTLESMGPLHGYALARRIEQISDNTVIISETGRRAKFYSLTKLGRQKIATETENWERISTTMARFLAPST